MASTTSLSTRWKWTALLWSAWRAMTLDLSAGRRELFVTLEYHFSFLEYCTQFTYLKKKILKIPEGFRKGTALLHFSTCFACGLDNKNLWPAFFTVWWKVRALRRLYNRTLSRNSSKSESKRPSGSWVMQREKGEISVAQGPNCNSLWRSMGSGCYWAWTENASVYKKKVSAHHSSRSCGRQLSHWAVHCLCCRIRCQTTSAWKLYFSRLALTFIDQKKDYRPDSSSFHATAVPQKLMELHQHIPGMGLAQQSGSAGVSARQLLGKKSSCSEFPPCEQQHSFWEPVHRIFERERFSSVGSISPVRELHADILYRKNLTGRALIYFRS